MAYVLRASITAVPTICMYYWLQTGVYVMAAMIQMKEFLPQYVMPLKDPNKVYDLFTIISFEILWAKVTHLIIQNMGGFGILAGFANRAMGVVAMGEESCTAVASIVSKIEKGMSPALKNVTISLPGNHNRELVRGISEAFATSTSISGVGTSSVFRVLRGLWPVKSGQVSCPDLYGPEGAIFLPQLSYASQGSLAAQVVYPSLVTEVDATEGSIEEILEAVGLKDVLGRWGLHRVANWELVLSGGECQRLGFARLLFHKPKYAIMDESTSALDLALEAKCMGLIDKISLLSVATRPSMRKYHKRNVEILADGVEIHY